MARFSFKNYSLIKYLDQLSAREPAPGGGSAAALSAGLGAALMVMVARYSLGKSGSHVDSKLNALISKIEKKRKKLLELVDLDAQAYWNLVQTKNNPLMHKKAQKQAIAVPREICRLSYEVVQDAPFLVQKGSKYLVSDVEAAVEFLLAGFNAALAMIKSNQ